MKATFGALGNITFNDHVALWSRMDFMMSLGKDKWRTFLFEVKGRVNPHDWTPDQRDLVGATRQAIKKAYGFSVLQFDDKWLPGSRRTTRPNRAGDPAALRGGPARGQPDQGTHNVSL